MLPFRPSYPNLYSRLRYPRPYFDIASTTLPSDMKELFRWCAFWVMTDGVVNAVVSKKAEYPVTSVVFETSEQKLKEKYEEFAEEVLNLRAFLIEVGLDYETYGNAFVSVMFPFVKYLKCPRCGYQVQASEARKFYQFRGYNFDMECPSCHQHVTAKAHDVYISAPEKITLKRWNPENIVLTANTVTDVAEYKYRVPDQERARISAGTPRIVETTPQVFLDALREQKVVVFGPDAIFHLKRPIISHDVGGWGMPSIFPVLKNLFLLATYKKANEVISQEHITPQRFVSPSTASSDVTPYGTMNLSQWRDQVQIEFERHRKDPNYISIMPVPMSLQTLGGQGRALLLHQEERLVAEQVVAGQGVPLEFIFGGLSYTGTSVSLRMLEHHFIIGRSHRIKLVNWIFKRITKFMQWPYVPAKFTKFRMADDMQDAMFKFQLKQAGEVSGEYLAEQVGYNKTIEDERIEKEQQVQIQREKTMQLARAQLQAQAQNVMASTQLGHQMEMARMQQQQQGQVQPGTGMAAPISPDQEGDVVGQLATKISRMPSDKANAALDRIKQVRPELHGKVVAQISKHIGNERDPLNPQQYPTPEQKPPRRPESRQV